MSLRKGWQKGKSFFIFLGILEGTLGMSLSSAWAGAALPEGGMLPASSPLSSDLDSQSSSGEEDLDTEKSSPASLLGEDPTVPVVVGAVSLLAGGGALASAGGALALKNTVVNPISDRYALSQKRDLNDQPVPSVSKFLQASQLHKDPELARPSKVPRQDSEALSPLEKMAFYSYKAEQLQEEIQERKAHQKSVVEQKEDLQDIRKALKEEKKAFMKGKRTWLGRLGFRSSKEKKAQREILNAQLSGKGTAKGGGWGFVKKTTTPDPHEHKNKDNYDEKKYLTPGLSREQKEFLKQTRRYDIIGEEDSSPPPRSKTGRKK